MQHTGEFAFRDQRFSFVRDIATRKDCFKICVVSFHSLNGFIALEFRQSGIENRHRDLVFVLAMQLHCFDAIFSNQDFEPLPDQ